jgi:hypothetical protein
MGEGSCRDHGNVIYNVLVCAAFGHKGDAQQNSCNLYSVGDGVLLRAAYVRVLTSCHAFLTFWCSRLGSC